MKEKELNVPYFMTTHYEEEYPKRKRKTKKQSKPTTFEYLILPITVILLILIENLI